MDRYGCRYGCGHGGGWREGRCPTVERRCAFSGSNNSAQHSAHSTRSLSAHSLGPQPARVLADAGRCRTAGAEAPKTRQTRRRPDARHQRPPSGRHPPPPLGWPRGLPPNRWPLRCLKPRDHAPWRLLSLQPAPTQLGGAGPGKAHLVPAPCPSSYFVAQVCYICRRWLAASLAAPGKEVQQNTESSVCRLLPVGLDSFYPTPLNLCVRLAYFSSTPPYRLPGPARFHPSIRPGRQQ